MSFINVILLNLFFILSVFAQTSQLYYNPRTMQEEEDTARAEPQEPLLRALPQDKIIDPDTYILGPGDEISIAIIGPISHYFNQPITPEGKLILPELDVYQLQPGETLSHFRARLKNSLQDYYKKAQFEILLSRLKQFRVSVTGQVERPGLYVVNGASRLSDVLAKAGLMERSSLRRIQVSNEENAENYDLLYFMRTGEEDHNPYLQQGDIIHIPANEPRFNKIQIMGAVNRPGIYEFRPGDTVQKLIDIAQGLFTNADSEHVTIARFRSNKSRYEKITISLKDQNNFPLKPDDRIMLYEINNFREKFTVRVVGEVQNPGFYPIYEGESTLAEVIEAAGPFTKDASLFKASLTRRAKEQIQDPELERLNKMMAADMEEIEREYWKIRNRETKNLVAVDFARLFRQGEKKYDVKLRDGDVISVPKVTKNITVSGAVINPGIQTFEGGRDFTYYISAAGGYSEKADESEAQIIKTRTGTWLNADEDVVLEEGDIIFIPEKPIRDYWQMFRDGLTVMTQVAALVAIVYNVSR